MCHEINVNEIKTGDSIEDKAGEVWKIVEAGTDGAYLKCNDHTYFLPWSQVKKYGKKIINRKGTKASFKKVNAALPKGYELHKGGGCFHFSGPDCGSWYSSTVYTFKLSDYSLERWIEEFEWLREKYGKKEN
jgi:hypothetical protein